jgi:hypothetical protein
MTMLTPEINTVMALLSPFLGPIMTYATAVEGLAMGATGATSQITTVVSEIQGMAAGFTAPVTGLVGLSLPALPGLPGLPIRE